MIIHNIDPGSEQWWRIRAGLPTASAFDRLLTPTGKRSTQREAYMYGLLAAWVMGIPSESPDTQWMERGRILEPEAAAWYEMERGVNADLGGFVTRDDGRAGCSPDRLLYAPGETDINKPIGGLEIKCPSPEVHYSYLLGGKGIADKYRHQVQGSLWVTGLEWWDTLSYHSMLRPSLVRVERDDAYIALLEEAVLEFCHELDALKANERALGYGPPAIEKAA